jgi:hypothetical protein
LLAEREHARNLRERERKCGILGRYQNMLPV